MEILAFYIVGAMIMTAWFAYQLKHNSIFFSLFLGIFWPITLFVSAILLVFNWFMWEVDKFDKY